MQKVKIKILIIFILLAAGCWLLVAASNIANIANAAGPAIVSVYPANGATNVEIRPLITVYFDKDINPATVNNDTFKLKNKFLYTTYISGEVSYSVSEKKAVFKLNGDLINNTKYTAVLTTGIKDSSGNQMASEYVWDFTTEKSRDATGTVTRETPPSLRDATTTATSTVTRETPPSPHPAVSSIELPAAEQPPLEKTDEASPAVSKASKTIGRGIDRIVPCGWGNLPKCEICHLFIGVKNIIDFLTLDIALPLAVVILIYGGVMILTSGGSEEKLKKGKTALWMAIWGIVIVFAGWLIIDTIIKAIGAGGLGEIKGWGPWNKIPTC